MKEVVGKVTPEERDEIKKLFGRKNALIDLLKTIENGSAMYEKAMEDLIDTNEKFQNWWDITAKKYSWKGAGTVHWEINFESCEIFIANKQ
jgi:CXXX repeat modification system protein